MSIFKEDWNCNKNQLTWGLFWQGYNPLVHPDYVQWVDYRMEFEYKIEYLAQTIWVSPCGLLRKGKFEHGYMSYMGIDWRHENNNFVYPCPYRKKECQLMQPLLRDYHYPGISCEWKLASVPYDYGNSVEKMEDERAEKVRVNLQEAFGYPSMAHCMCCHIDEDTLKPVFRYDPKECIRFMRNSCDNEECYCTKEKRDLTLANIFYDVLTEEPYQIGFITGVNKHIRKGIKVFDSPKAVTDLNMWLKVYPDLLQDKESRDASFYNLLGRGIKKTVLHIRIEKRATKDLMQDVMDARDGFTVLHESDLKNKDVQIKKEKREKKTDAKERRKSKNKIKQLKHICHTGMNLNGEIMSESVKARAQEELLKIEGYTYRQLSLFDDIA